MNKNSSESRQGHRGVPSSESQATPELNADPWPPNRVWLPDGVVMLAAVSPELENVEGAFWVRESAALVTVNEPAPTGIE